MSSYKGIRTSAWSFLLHTMLLIQLSNANIELPTSNNNSNDQKDNNSEMIFFTLKDLKIGNKIPIYFPKKDPSKTPHLLPRPEAETMPFSSTQLSNILKLFSFPQDSPQAKAVENTIRSCETRPIKGETKFCATSLESMLDFARGFFDKLSVATTKFVAKSSANFQNYTVLGLPRAVLAPKIVACHKMPYPYAVYYCHYQEGENKVYEISLLGEDGVDRVEAVAVCHMDTSHWSRDHASFRVLGIEPGSSPVCHFFPEDNLVWIPKA